MASIIPSNAAQQCVQWTGGYAARFLSFFVALSFFHFNGESQPAHQRVSREDHTGRAAHR